MLLTRLEYAAHRGITRQAVEYALKKGVITEQDGKIDPEKADRLWAENMRVRAKAVNSTRAPQPVRAPAVERPRKPRPPAPPPPEDDLSDLLGVNPPPAPPTPRAPPTPPAPPAPVESAYSTSRAAREKASAEIIMLKARQMAGNLIDAEDVAKTWTAVAHDIRAAFLQLPARLAPMLVGRDLLAIRNALDQEVRSILERLASP